MPFVKRSHLQDPSSVDVLPLFIGRAGELLFFVHNILQPDAPTHNILSISGQGGVGKSTLLARFIAGAHEAPYKDYCLTAIIDERQSTPVGMMEKFAQQLHLTGEFAKALKQYKEMLRRQQVERETFYNTLFESVPDIAGAAVEGIPIAGPLLREGTRVATRHLLKEKQASQHPPNAPFWEPPLDDLTRAFVTELNRLADAKVTLDSTQKKRQRRIVLFFDTFEQLAAETTPWLLDHFLDAQISDNVVLVVAGRDPIEHTSPDDPKRWLRYCDDNTIYWISLNSFTEDEIRMYLVKKGITDPDQIVNIWHLSRGLPLYLGLLTSNPQGDIDPTKDVVVNFLRWIPEQEHIKRQVALDAALFTKPFNLDDLEVFSYVSESNRVPLYQWLTEQPFVRSRVQDGRYLYHDVTRDLFSRHGYQRSQKHYDEIRGALAKYYQGLLENIQTGRGKEVYHLEEWLELLLAVISQLLLLPDQASHIKAIELILHTYSYTNKEQDREILRTLRDLSQESSFHYISSAARKIAIQLLHYFESDYYSQERLVATGALLEKLAHIPPFPSKLLVALHKNRGRAYRSLQEKELAFESFQQALTLLESTDHVERGWIYFYCGDYQEALAYHSQALEQNPQDAYAHVGRGWAYHKLEEYQQAIADFERAAEMDQNANPGGRSNGLRWAHYNAGKYQEALAANDYYVKHDPEDYKPHVFRLRCYLLLKDYQHTTEEYNRVFELAPKRTDACVEVGWAYFYARSYPEALAYHNQALEQNPQDAHAHVGRGWVYHKLGEYQQAIADFEHAAELDQNANPAGRSNGLRWAYYGAGKYQEALAVNDYQVKRDPEGYDPYVFRSRCFCSLKDYLQSIDECNHALELAPKQVDVYFQRGLTYLWLKDLGQAQSDFTRSCELKQTSINFVLMAEWVGLCQKAANPKVLERLETIVAVDPQCYSAHVCQGIVLLLRRHFRETLTELEQALLQKRNDDWDAHFWQGMAHAFLEQDEEAIAAIEKALELELPPILLTPLHWFEQERPDFYEKYAVPLLAKHV